jgi:hypothetical protein
MLKDLILRAKTVLDQSHPPEGELVEAENALSAYLEAIATERISEPVDLTDLEHANRLLREVRRERSRRLQKHSASNTQMHRQPAARARHPNVMTGSTSPRISAKMTPMTPYENSSAPAMTRKRKS